MRCAKKAHELSVIKTGNGLAVFMELRSLFNEADWLNEIPKRENSVFSLFRSSASRL